MKEPPLVQNQSFPISSKRLMQKEGCNTKKVPSSNKRGVSSKPEWIVGVQYEDNDILESEWVDG